MTDTTQSRVPYHVLLLDLERRFAEAGQKQDRDFFHKHVSDDALMILGNGMRTTKALLVNMYPDSRMHDFTMSKVETGILGNGVGVICYDVVVHVSFKEGPVDEYRYRVTTIWKLDGNVPTILFHQATAITA